MLRYSEKTPWLMSFARRKGRAFPIYQESLVNRLLPNISISLPEEVKEPLNLPSLFSSPPKETWLEIGFGGGEHLAHQAALHPDIQFIGCEPYMNGVASLLSYIDRESLHNIRVFTDDARFLLHQLPDHSISKIFILYPDPWRRPKHYKRRLISNDTLDMLARILTKGGELQLATDHSHYAKWMIEHLEKHPAFAEGNSKTSRNLPPANWVSTRYEQKAIEQGIETMTYLHFIRKAD